MIPERNASLVTINIVSLTGKSSKVWVRGVSNVMIKDAFGFLWVGGQDGSLSRFDGATFKKYLPSKDESGLINSDHINALVEDSLSNIWIGTSKGLSMYDRQSDSFKNFVTKADSISADT